MEDDKITDAEAERMLEVEHAKAMRGLQRIRMRGTDGARVIQVIETKSVRGSGTLDDMCRPIRQYWDFDGNLLAEYDPCQGDKDATVIPVDDVQSALAHLRSEQERRKDYGKEDLTECMKAAQQTLAIVNKLESFDADIAQDIIKAMAEHAVSGWLQDRLYQTNEQRGMMIMALLCAQASLSGCGFTEEERNKARQVLNDFYRRWYSPDPCGAE